MRLARALTTALLLAIAACNRGETFGGEVDTALLHRPGGDVMLADGGRLAYEITSDRYRQWEAARRALRAQRISLSLQVDPLRVSQADVDRAVRFFERNAKGRRAIEDTGLSVRDYVLTTIALEQQMAVASGRWGTRAGPRVASRPVAPSESIAAELARDSARRTDTIPVVDTVVVPVDTTARPDTTSPPDTTAAPAPGPSRTP